ncbi:MAG TPA: precorrin-8X methylmutase [Acidaminococcaceae bacterium]|nr:precorrin-8X methylmutase [Acidaminococcaceae bacterium]
MNLENVLPMDIEKRSFEIITEELGQLKLDPEKESIIKRVIHTSADFDYARNLRFSGHVVEDTLVVLKQGGFTIVTDTKMANVGINKTALARLGGTAVCFMSDPDVAARAREAHSTRAAACMEKACTLEGPVIIAVGNAPTALVRLDELIREGRIKPALVIGVPVGFVNVVQSKEIIMQSGVPYIVAVGRKGGSNVAASICNALLYKLTASQEQVNRK